MIYDTGSNKIFSYTTLCDPLECKVVRILAKSDIIIIIHVDMPIYCT